MRHDVAGFWNMSDCWMDISLKMAAGWSVQSIVPIPQDIPFQGDGSYEDSIRPPRLFVTYNKEGTGVSRFRKFRTESHNIEGYDYIDEFDERGRVLPADVADRRLAEKELAA